MNATATQTMIKFKNILYATDFSSASEAALPYAKALAEQYGATVHALHVRMPATYPIVGPEAMPQVIEAAEELAKFEARQLHDMFPTTAHDVCVTEGELWTAVENMIREQKIDMIIIGTHGRTGIGRALLGSAAEEIFRKATCPVLTVGPHISKDTEHRLEMKEILFATDFSEESIGALPYAVSLAQEHQAYLTILHVIGEPEVGDLINTELYMASTLRRLRELVPNEADHWCMPEFEVARGNAAEKIMETAETVGADLIVLGVRSARDGAGAVTHLLRPTAHRIITQATCPVLTVCR